MAKQLSGISIQSLREKHNAKQPLVQVQIDSIDRVLVRLAEIRASGAELPFNAESLSLVNQLVEEDRRAHPEDLAIEKQATLDWQASFKIPGA